MTTEKLPITLEQIQEYSDRIAAEFKPERIILFGSYAYGSPTADSDVDLLVVMSFEGNSIRKAVEIRNKVDANFPVDLLVRTPAQVKQQIEWNDWFMCEIVEKGKVVYAAYPGVSPESRVAKGWPPGYFEQTAGSLPDFPDVDGETSRLDPSLDRADQDLRFGPPEEDDSQSAGE